MRTISEITKEIKADWKKPYFGAVPYIQAMQSIGTIDEMYGWERADSIVRYFLGNATTWRGETARRIKSELKGMLK